MQKKIWFVSFFILFSWALFAQDSAVKLGDDKITAGSMDFVRIPAGTFTMGNSSGQAEADELPLHNVEVESFYIAVHELTLAQFKEFAEETEYKIRGAWKGSGSNHPVVYVTWFDAVEYCLWFSRKYEINARLPTEAEWEKAARGGVDGRNYPFGDSISASDANYSSSGTKEVGSYAPNGYGLYDTVGNVFEWCSDWYLKDYYQKSPDKNPQGDLTGVGVWRSVRGGSFNYDSSKAYSANRAAFAPQVSKPDIGFRIVIEDR